MASEAEQIGPQWDPYPGTIPASARCATCGKGPIVHALESHAFVMDWLPIEGIETEGAGRG